MNKHRRKDLDQAVELLEKAAEILGQAGEDEQIYADEMPENMHGCEKHERAEEIAGDLMFMPDELEELVERIREAQA